MGKEKIFTLQELKNYNRKDGSPIYFAYKGKVYDATNSFLWKKGRHQAMHSAGEDLTESLKDAPHGESLLNRLPVVGLLKDEKKSSDS